ncbi:Myosin type-2 heavy chain 1 [Lobosporangium transversale]|uniref:p-loop containing nucleoside triphosphate hydrolase protein n=1 Tax=Lobosporangium transversale TaxID=64571 RepID=A0A1Y2GNI5_9FUNG|nr:P-loop containing nucleoside triphosphate hydrolase protein [Lobosporangium transversale]KAF9918847.1 Myosin type-2 heavy chain 1 [Lobosporangium transversale]ORZ16742.1 P-loop containing nucleoside triphosphate hydrolase protein [Lobosporangium transversale]|eukprot:XP_021881677.1 P-loop containing nucleoside triphosphate hydrolase protein [Lobosporangium transversale]
MSLDAYVKGTNCWFTDDKEGWISAALTTKEETPDGKVTLKFVDDNGKEHSFSSTLAKIQQTNGADLPPMRNPPLLEGTEDLTNLSYLNEPAVLSNIRTRYSHCNIYTYSGIVLIAANPFARVNLYTQDIIQAYSGRRRGELEPHLFAIAEDAYRCMIRDEKNQTIVVSGESGAGKTVSAKFIMRYFATADDSERGTDSSKTGMSETEEQILATNPIMEAFGNAKTTRNDNSSRFGKFTEIQFDKERNIIGAKIRTYLLERSRLVYQPEHERNYHIFYQLVAGAPPSEKKELDLQSIPQFHYLKQGGVQTINGVDDAAEFEITQRALSTIGISVQSQWDIFRLLAALLHIGNIQVTGRNEAVISEDDPSLITATRILGIPLSEFKKWLVKKQITTRSEKIVSSLKVDQSLIVRDSVAKYIYSSLFDWLVNNINSSLSSEAVASRIHSFIGVLDIYGFEHFKKNSFEQFCINYANEKLQQEFNQHVFKLEQEEYVREKIDWKFIEFSDNQPCIEMIEGKLGVLSLLDEESRLPAGSDQSWCNKLFTQLGTEKHKKWFTKPRFSNTAFTISHYAHDVTYDCEGFLEKNRDTLPDELLNLIKNSENELLEEVLMTSATLGAGGSLTEDKRKSVINRKPTLGSIFKGSLIQLMDTINSTNVHYIRCLKPNEAKQPWAFDAPMVLGQLRACGVLETIRISCAGYPSRWSFPEFVERYYMLVNSEHWGFDTQKMCSAILEATIKEADKYQVGLTKIFFRAGLLAYMEKLRTDKLNAYATLIQKNLRRFVCQKKYHRQRNAAIKIQAFARRIIAQKEARKLREERSAIMLQTFLRGYVQRKKYVETRNHILRIQCAIRAKHARLAFQKMRETNAATMIQQVWRGIQARAHHKKEIRAIILVQSCIRRSRARKALLELKAEARSVNHLKEVSYRLEGKVVELTRALDLANQQNKSFDAQVASLENQVRLWKEKYELSQQTSARELALAAENPTVPKNEFETLKAANVELESKYNASVEKVRTLDQEISKLTESLAKTKEEIQKLAAQAKAKPEDSETVTALRRENQYVREQLAQLSKATGRDTSSFPVSSKVMAAPTSGHAQTHTTPPTHNHLAQDTIDKYENSYSFTKDTPHKIVTAFPPIPHSNNLAPKIIGRHRSNSTPDIASLENGVLFRPQKTTNSVFDNLDNHSRTAKTMSGDDWSRRINRSRPSIHSMVEQPEVEIMHILEDEEGLQEEVLNGLIKNMKIPSPSLSNLPLIKEIMFPAHMIGLLTTQMWRYGYIKESERLMINVMQAVQQQSMAIVGDDTIIPCAYWLSNVHELLSYICISEQEITREELVARCGEHYDWAEYEQLVSTVKYELECLEYNIFHVWMKSLKKQLNKMIIPAIIESQALPGFITSDSGRFFNKLMGSGPSFSMDDLLMLFNKIWKAMSCYYVEHSVVRQVMTELLKMVGVTGFNDLLMRRNFCTWKRAMQIQYNITRIEEWCKGHDLPEGTLQLEHLMQATKLLQLKKASHSDIEIIYDVCWMLTPTQVQKLVQNYMIADYEVPVSPELIKAIAMRVAANEKNDTLMLDAISLEDAGSFETPEIRDVDLDGERYLPPWLVNLSRLKSLMHLVVV